MNWTSAEALKVKLAVGWDVGGWHCDRNKSSRDALVVTEVRDGSVQILGRAWRGNLRALLVSETRDGLIDSMLNLCGVDGAAASEIVIAIDTPLGWPAAMMRLANGGEASAVSAKDGENPYTRRKTELALVRRGFSPLSAVRDMLGSQATKGLHFLRAAGLSEVSSGVWSHTDEKQRVVTAIETYPAVALQMEPIATTYRTVGKGLGQQPFHDDVRDAFVCALLAHEFIHNPQGMEPVPSAVPSGEGWIMLPAPKSN